MREARQIVDQSHKMPSNSAHLSAIAYSIRMLDTYHRAHCCITPPRSIKRRKSHNHSQLHSYKLWHSMNWYHVRVPRAHIEALNAP